MDKKDKSKSRVGVILGGVALTVVGFWMIPPLISRFGRKIYKATRKNDSIDFSKLGPEIVKDNTEEMENSKNGA